MSKNNYISDFDDEDFDPNHLPDDLRIVWLWLNEQGYRLAGDEDKAWQADDEGRAKYLHGKARLLCSLMDDVFTEVDERAQQSRSEANTKLAQWKQSVNISREE